MRRDMQGRGPRIGRLPPRIAGRLRPSNWPVRWRLAGVSAGLTLAILLVFGGLLGKLVTQRIYDDFDSEVRNTAQTLASELQVLHTPVGTLIAKGPRFDELILPGEAAARLIDINGEVRRASPGSAALGPLQLGLHNHGETRVTAVTLLDSSGAVSGYVQYGRSLAQVESTVDTVWLLIAAGVFAGTLLASLAGIAIAGRAMRPISALTATARKVADTGDPSRHMPMPRSDDEVGELARTLEQMLRSLDAARAEREAALERQREFVADASHELRTPLTSILANLELLQASLQSPGQDDDRAMADSALRSSQRMSRLVGDLLLLARADAGRTGERRSCDLAEIASEAASEAAPTLGGRRLQIEVPASPVPVNGNPDELHRMVLNLLDNSARHTPEGSEIELRLLTSEGRAVLEVADDGPGIPPELREQIFKRFARGSGPADTMSSPGTGLGLAIVRAVAASHGGRAEAAESAQGGALIRISLPFSDAGTTAAPLLHRA